MSRNKPPRKAYRPRAVALDPMAVAIDGAAKPAAADVEQVLKAIQAAFTSMREGVATELQWSILAGALDVAKAIDQQGIVRGMHEHLATTDQALETIYNRAHADTSWRPTPLYFAELDALREFVNLHAFQLRQLGRAEYLQAVYTATSRIRNNHGTATVVRRQGMMGMAA